jgi:hypothetical protein
MGCKYYSILTIGLLYPFERFLLARLHTNSLMKNTNNTLEVRETLAALSNGVDAAYDEIMYRINMQAQPARSRLANQIICWVAYTFRRLSIEELLHALAVRPGDSDLNPEAMVSKEDLTKVCAGLVMIDEKCMVRFFRK